MFHQGRKSLSFRCRKHPNLKEGTVVILDEIQYAAEFQVALDQHEM